MTKMRGNKARFYLDHEDIYLNANEVEQSLETVIADTSTYGGEFDSAEPIRVRGRFSLQAFMTDDYRDPADTVNQLSEKFFFGRMIDPTSGLVRAVPAVWTLIQRNAPVVGDNAIFTQGYGSLGTAIPKDGISALRFQAQGTGPIHNGKILYMTEVTLDDSVPGTSDIMNGVAVDLGDATRVIRTAIHVINYVVNSGTPTGVNAKIQSDAISGMTTPTDRQTLTQITNEGQEWKETLVDYANAAEDWHRLRLDKVGAGSITIGIVCVAYTA
jgi:hypothetical protein